MAISTDPVLTATADVMDLIAVIQVATIWILNADEGAFEVVRIRTSTEPQAGTLLLGHEEDCIVDFGIIGVDKSGGALRSALVRVGN